MKKFFLVLLLLTFSASSAFGLENESQDVKALSLQDCLTIALTNHPSLKKSKGAIKAAEAAINQTKSTNRVKVSATARTGLNGDYQFWDDRYHSGSLSLTISKILYDTNVNKLNIQIGNENLYGVQESERQTQLDVAANAKKAYYDLVLKILARDVEKEKLKNLEQHLITARGIYEVGNSSYIDVTKAEADYASAEVSLLKAENDILLSQEALKIAMGINSNENFDLALSTNLLLPRKSGEVSDLLKIAIKDRPDYKKLQHTLNADELNIKVAARSNSPTITGSVGSDLSKRDGSKATR
ncbi:MAG: TolC family protein, partial [Synergistaceae bacterium]|nr:TolC family protein [Synergistaceae bacterium]